MSSYPKTNRPLKDTAPPPEGKPGIKQRIERVANTPKAESKEDYKMGILKLTEEASRTVGMVRKEEFNAKLKLGDWPRKMQISILKNQ